MFPFEVKAMAIESIYIKDIIADADIQPRAELNGDTVTEYAEAMRSGDQFPAIKVFKDAEGKHWLADGFHRYEAHKLLNKRKIDCEVESGERRDAVLYAIGANSKNGMRLNNADKRKTATKLLTDPEWSKWSDNFIAAKMGATQPFVSRVRRELAEADGESVPKSRYAQRGDQTYEIKTASTVNNPGGRKGKNNVVQLQPHNDRSETLQIETSNATTNLALDDNVSRVVESDDVVEIDSKENAFADDGEPEIDVSSLQSIKLGATWKCGENHTLVYQNTAKLKIKIEEFDFIIYCGDLEIFEALYQSLYDQCGYISLLLKNGADLQAALNTIDLPIASTGISAVAMVPYAVITYIEIDDNVPVLTPDVATNSSSVFISDIIESLSDPAWKVLIVDPPFETLAYLSRSDRAITSTHSSEVMIHKEVITWNRLHSKAPARKV